MDKNSILEKVISTPDDQIRDDDHLEREGLSAEDANKGFAELYEKFKDKPAPKEKSNDFAQGIINVLNNPSIATD